MASPVQAPPACRESCIFYDFSDNRCRAFKSVKIRPGETCFSPGSYAERDPRVLAELMSRRAYLRTLISEKLAQDTLNLQEQDPADLELLAQGPFGLDNNYPRPGV